MFHDQGYSTNGSYFNVLNGDSVSHHPGLTLRVKGKYHLVMRWIVDYILLINMIITVDFLTSITVS